MVRFVLLPVIVFLNTFAGPSTGTGSGRGTGTASPISLAFAPTTRDEAEAVPAMSQLAGESAQGGGAFAICRSCMQHFLLHLHVPP